MIEHVIPEFKESVWDEDDIINLEEQTGGWLLGQVESNRKSFAWDGKFEWSDPHFEGIEWWLNRANQKKEEWQAIEEDFLKCLPLIMYGDAKDEWGSEISYLFINIPNKPGDYMINKFGKEEAEQRIEQAKIWSKIHRKIQGYIAFCDDQVSSGYDFKMIEYANTNNLFKF